MDNVIWFFVGIVIGFLFTTKVILPIGIIGTIRDNAGKTLKQSFGDELYEVDIRRVK